MNIVVCIKQTIDTATKILLGANGELCVDEPKYIINPHDEYAIEEAVHLKEALGGSVCAITIGDSGAQKILRTAMAMGVDKSILVDSELLMPLDEWSKVKILAKVIKEGVVFEGETDLVITGKASSDRGSGQVCYRLAEELGIPSVDGAFSVSVDGNVLQAICDIDGERETVKVELPAAFTAQKGLNDPRFASFAGLMKANKKPLVVVRVNDLGMNVSDVLAKTETLSRFLPPIRPGVRVLSGGAFQDASELAKLLRDEAKVI